MAVMVAWAIARTHQACKAVLVAMVAPADVTTMVLLVMVALVAPAEQDSTV